MNPETIKMMHPEIIEGTPAEIRDRLQGIGGNIRLTLIIPADVEQKAASESLHDATPEERARALDEIAEMNRNLPTLAEDAFRRENLYEERP